MIDTVRFFIPIREEHFKAISSRGFGIFKVDGSSRFTSLKAWNSLANLGSFDMNLNLFLPSSDVCYLEFSLPKYLNGHNISLINAQDAIKAMDKIYIDLVDFYGIFPPYKMWLVCRLDICYAWKLKNQFDADRAMSVLKLLQYKGFKALTYPSGVSFGTNAKFNKSRAP